MRKKVVTILGARPQFIKASVVSKQFELRANQFTEIVIHTGQHFDREMSDVFFANLGMRKPEYQLGIHGGSHADMTGRMMSSIEPILFEEKADAILVYGDTNSTLAGALVAAKLHIPIAHVEAGLRSFNSKMPEEINRIVTDRISNWLFAPTQLAVKNLYKEGMSEEKVILVGDVMYDAILSYKKSLDSDSGLIKQLNLIGIPYALVTIHRAENTDKVENLKIIIDALSIVARQIRVIWPLHPRTKYILENQVPNQINKTKIIFIPPIDYFDMMQLQEFAAVIATDSGGLQKEAFFHRVPCVTIREETEWCELLHSRWNRLSPPNDSRRMAKDIISAIGILGDDIQPYGNGDASSKIVDHLSESCL